MNSIGANPDEARANSGEILSNRVAPRTADDVHHLLLTNLLAGQEVKLRQYVARHIPVRHSTMIAVDDIIQDVWISAFRYYPGFKPDNRPHAFERWVMTLTNHSLLNAVKFLDRRPIQIRPGTYSVIKSVDATDRFADALNPASRRARTPSREVRGSEAAREIQAAMAVLDEAQRCAVQRRYFDGESLEQIATAMQSTPTAIHGLLFRGLRQLRRILGNSGRFFTDSRSAHS